MLGEPERPIGGPSGVEKSRKRIEKGVRNMIGVNRWEREA